MKADKTMKPGAIVQIVQDDELGSPLMLMVATKIETWGVKGYLAGTAIDLSRTWNLIEPTGGAVKFDRDGKPFTPAPESAKHHP